MLFDVQLADHGGCSVLSIVGEVDLATAPRVRQAVIRLVTTGDRRPDAGPRVVVDLSGVDLIDSVGLGVMIGALRRVRAADGQLALVVPRGQVRTAFTATGLDRLFALFPTLAEARDAVAAGDPGEPTHG